MYIYNICMHNLSRYRNRHKAFKFSCHNPFHLFTFPHIIIWTFTLVVSYVDTYFQQKTSVFIVMLYINVNIVIL